MKFLSKEEVLSECKPFRPARQFIYFLIRDREIVYVGQSEMPLGRIAQHSWGRVPKIFDSYRVIEIPMDADVDEVERQYIYNFRPEYNTISGKAPASFVPSGATIEDRIRSRIAAGQTPGAAAAAEGLKQTSFYNTRFYRELVGRPPRAKKSNSA